MGFKGLFWFSLVVFFFLILCSCLLPFHDFFGMISLEWFWKEKQLFTSHWTLRSQEREARPSLMERGKVPAPPCSDLGPTSQRLCSRPHPEAQQVLKHGGTEL